jgi:7,8-dihydroneopterin aldolase/epimerase/oxygenase
MRFSVAHTETRMIGFTCANTTVFVSKLQIPAYVGLHAPERDALQMVEIDITCTLKNANAEGDDLSQSVDYVPAVEAVRALALQKRRRLIETLAEEIAVECFMQENTKSCEVSIRKPHKLPGTSSVGITRTFTRKGE